MSSEIKNEKKNQLVVKSGKKTKISFTDFNKYRAAVKKDKDQIDRSNERIHDIEEELRKLKLMEKEMEAAEKEAKKKALVVKKPAPAKKKSKANEIPTDKKHELVSLSDFEAYNYDKRRKEWHKKAGHNPEQVVCSLCKDDDNWATVQLDNGHHICYFCWVKKPTKAKLEAVKKPAPVKPVKKVETKPAVVKKVETKPAVVKKPAPVKKAASKKEDEVDYEKLYGIELETLRAAFEVLPTNEKKAYNKKVYDMIDHLIDKKYIEKKH